MLPYSTLLHLHLQPSCSNSHEDTAHLKKTLLITRGCPLKCRANVNFESKKGMNHTTERYVWQIVINLFFSLFHHPVHNKNLWYIMRYIIHRGIHLRKKPIENMIPSVFQPCYVGCNDIAGRSQNQKLTKYLGVDDFHCP